MTMNVVTAPWHKCPQWVIEQAVSAMNKIKTEVEGSHLVFPYWCEPTAGCPFRGKFVDHVHNVVVRMVTLGESMLSQAPCSGILEHGLFGQIERIEAFEFTEHKDGTLITDAERAEAMAAMVDHNTPQALELNTESDELEVAS